MQGANLPIRSITLTCYSVGFFSVCVCVCLFKIESATEATMTELIEDVLSCGYNGPVNVEKREEIVRYNCFFTILILVKDVSIHVLIFYI